MIIHRPKLRWSPKLGHIMHRRICPSIRDRLRWWREAVNAVTLRDDNRPKLKNLVCWGGVCVTVRVPIAFRNKCERVTGPQPERVRSIYAGVNATQTSGTGPERNRNAKRNRCENGLSYPTLSLWLSRSTRVSDQLASASKRIILVYYSWILYWRSSAFMPDWSQFD